MKRLKKRPLSSESYYALLLKQATPSNQSTQLGGGRLVLARQTYTYKFQ